MTDIDTYISESAKNIDLELKKQIPQKLIKEQIEALIKKTNYTYDTEALTKSLIEPTWYLLNLGGKRWRPTLMLLFLEALGKNQKDYLKYSIIPEIIHNATLIHDDIEDSSKTRRGAPAVHIKYGIDVATNLGDFLFFYPITFLSSDKTINDEIKSKVFNIYLENMIRVTIGQAADIAWHAGLIDSSKISEKEYLQMSNDKTGVLARFSCELSGILAGAEDETIKKLGDFGAAVGIAFQIQDDILNIDESKVSESKGGVGDDITEGKITLMVIRALQVSSSEDSKRLLNILSEHTTDKEKIKEAIKILNNCDSLNYSRKVAENIIKEAWGSIAPLLKESKAKAQLMDFSEFMIKRLR